jgi:hypothetical protein
MNYKKTYTNKYLRITVHTNSNRLSKLISSVLDLGSIAVNSRPSVSIEFYLEERSARAKSNESCLYERIISSKNSLVFFAVNKSIVMEVDPKANSVKGSIFGFKKIPEGRLIEFVIMKPLRFILARHGFFFLHASLVCKDEDCVLIHGSQKSGKSTLALLLYKNGYNFLSDDDCYIKIVRNRVSVFPFPTKIGLSEKIINLYPEFNKLTLKNYLYCGKRRISSRNISFNTSNYSAYRCKMIIFPIYDPQKIACLKKISQWGALTRLLRQKKEDDYPEGGLQEMLWASSAIAKSADSFELKYCDDNITGVPRLIDGIFNAVRK